MVLLLPLAAMADEEMPSEEYDALAAKLIMNGFTMLHVVDAERGIMSAFDTEGSEVMLHVDPATRQITNMAYVHMTDE
ncbi:hypothetical protein [Oceanicola granulosus]|nr:hypothetical protein [Oceanicola granulosus]